MSGLRDGQDDAVVLRRFLLIVLRTVAVALAIFMLVGWDGMMIAGCIELLKKMMDSMGSRGEQEKQKYGDRA